MIKKYTMILALCIGIFSMPVTVVNAEPLSPKENTKQHIIHGLSALDAVTTIIGVGKGFIEKNAILGVAPEPHTVVAYFVVRQIAHEKITEYINAEIRPIWQNTWIGVTALCVVNNIMLIK